MSHQMTAVSGMTGFLSHCERVLSFFVILAWSFFVLENFTGIATLQDPRSDG
jgi:hypothetical protein